MYTDGFQAIPPRQDSARILLAEPEAEVEIDRVDDGAKRQYSSIGANSTIDGGFREKM